MLELKSELDAVKAERDLLKSTNKKLQKQTERHGELRRQERARHAKKEQAAQRQLRQCVKSLAHIVKGVEKTEQISRHRCGTHHP